MYKPSSKGTAFAARSARRFEGHCQFEDGIPVLICEGQVRIKGFLSPIPGEGRCGSSDIQTSEFLCSDGITCRCNCKSLGTEIAQDIPHVHTEVNIHLSRQWLRDSRGPRHVLTELQTRSIKFMDPLRNDQEMILPEATLIVMTVDT